MDRTGKYDRWTRQNNMTGGQDRTILQLNKTGPDRLGQFWHK